VQRSSASIGSLAGALAKAQPELIQAFRPRRGTWLTGASPFALACAVIRELLKKLALHATKMTA
jgi:hypothetical protein